jgi:tetratricopeptide (TPR) repeat protein
MGADTIGQVDGCLRMNRIIKKSDADRDAAFQTAVKIPLSATNVEYGFPTAIKALKGDNAGAIVDYGRAIEINPKDATAYINRGMARTYTEDWKGAASDAEKVISLKPEYADLAQAYFVLGVAIDARSHGKWVLRSGGLQTRQRWPSGTAAGGQRRWCSRLPARWRATPGRSGM